jgi:hypothetical protein
VLLIQHQVLVLLFKQRLCLSLTRCLGSLASFSFVFQWQLLSPFLPQWGVAVYIWVLSSVSRHQLCSPLAILIWNWVFTVLVYWGLVSLPHTLSLGQDQWSIRWPPAVSVLWWFVDYFSILQCHFTCGCCSLAQEMSFLDFYLPYFRQHLITVLLWALLLFSLCLLKVCMEISPLPLPPSVHLQHSASSAVC